MNIKNINFEVTTIMKFNPESKKFENREGKVVVKGKRLACDFKFRVAKNQEMKFPKNESCFKKVSTRLGWKDTKMILKNDSY